MTLELRLTPDQLLVGVLRSQEGGGGRRGVDALPLDVPLAEYDMAPSGSSSWMVCRMGTALSTRQAESV